MTAVCLRLVVILSLPNLVLAADSQLESATNVKEAPQSEDDKLQKVRLDGVWKPKAAILKGVFLPPPSLEGIRLKIDGNKYEVTVKGESSIDRGTFTIDRKTKPHRMTIKGKSGPNKGKTILAIVEVKNENAFRVCYDLSGKAFPKDFKAPKETELYTVGYRRQKDDSVGDTQKSAPAR